MDDPDPASPRWHPTQIMSRVLTAIVIVAIVAATVFANTMLGDRPDFQRTANYVIAGLIGAATGATELLSRYRDRPFDSVMSQSGLFYLAINAGVALATLFLMGQWGLLSKSDQAAQQVLTAGVAGMAFFRSGLFTARIGGSDVSVGPHQILKTILSVLDRAYDRERAKRRAELVGQVMVGIDFDTARTSLPHFCFKLMQNLSDEERQAVLREIDEIGDLGEKMSPEAKTMALGLALFGTVGESNVEVATKNLGNTISKFVPLEDKIVRVLTTREPDRVFDSIIDICNTLRQGRGQMTAEKAKAVKDTITAMNIEDAGLRATLLIYVLREHFGASLVEAALNLLPLQTVDITPVVVTNVTPAPAPTPTPTQTPTPPPPAPQNP